MIAVEDRNPKNYMGKCKHLQSSKRGLALIRKTGRPDPDICEELQSVASLGGISTCLMRIGMVTRKGLEGAAYF
jgi:hypothetical protein